jgi:hypothetical protein
MSDHDGIIANDTGSAVRADLNLLFQAILNGFSGTSAPAAPVAYQPWNDTTNGLRKQRNAANTGWLVRGSLGETFAVARSSNTILAAADYGRSFKYTSTFTQTLTAAATLGDGWHCEVRNTGSGVITIDPNSSETIDGATTLDLAPGYSCTIVCDGSNFFTFGLTRRRAEDEPGGRLTLTTGVPVTSSDVTGATTIYYSPLKSDTIELYDGAGWNKHQFAELSAATSDNTKSPAAVGASKNYDCFVWNDAGTLRVGRGPEWTSATGRGTGAGTTELEIYEGRYVNKIAITNGPAARRGVYVGTIRSDGSSQLNDSAALRHVWNMYNRRERSLRAALDTTNSWTYDSNTWRQANGASGNQLDVVRGLDEDAVSARAVHSAENSNAAGSGLIQTGIGLDSTSANSAQHLSAGANQAANTRVWATAHYSGLPGIGRRTFPWLERTSASATTTWYGDGNDPGNVQSGIQGEMLA